MTPQELKAVIRTIQDWQSKSPQEILALLQDETIPFVDPQKWTWSGLAEVFIPETGKRFGREGNKLLQDILLAQGDQWLISQLSNGISLIDDEIQATLYLLDSSGLVPGAKHIARAVKRNISLLEQAKLSVPSLFEIETVLKSMKLADLKELREEQAWDRIQAFKEAWTNYDGVGPEPVL
jgi:hypothetical protein